MRGGSTLSPLSGISIRRQPKPPDLPPLHGLEYQGHFRRFASRNQPYRFLHDFHNRNRHLLPKSIDIFEHQPIEVSDAAIKKSFLKYNVMSPTFDPLALDRAKNYLEYVIKKAGVGDYKPIPYASAVLLSKQTTGPGLPHKLYGISRKELLNMEGFKRRIDSRLASWRQQDGTVMASSVIGKYELRDLERVLAEKARTFSDDSFETLVIGKMFSHELSEQVMKASEDLTLPIFCGEDVLLLWKQLYKKLSKFDIFWDTDFSAWDSRLWSQLILAWYEIRYNLLTLEEQTPENKNAILSMAREVTETFMVLDTGEVFKKFHGNKSGQPNTFLDNSMCNLLAYYYLVFLHFEDQALEVLDQTFPVVCGDDLTIASTERYRPWLDSLTARYRKDLNFEPDSTGVKNSLLDVNFISAQFLVEENHVLLARDPNKIFSTLFFSDTEDSLVIRIMKIDAAISNLMPYPELIKILLHIRKDEVARYKGENLANPNFLLYNPPDFYEMKERCAL